MKSIRSDINIIQNTKRIITPYELDIYLPEYNIAIECNPTSTHNSSIDTFTGTIGGLPYNYHQMKTCMCEDKEILLFHIFGHEWNHKKEIIKSMISNLLHANSNKLYAR